MTKVLFITTRFPYPPKSGAEKVLMQYLSFLEGRDNAVVLCSFGSRRDADIGERCKELTRALPSIREVVLLDLPSLITVVINCLYYALLKRDKSFQECLYYGRSASERLRAVAAAHRPDIICFDMVRTMQYRAELEIGSARTVFLMQDMLSERYRGIMHTNLRVLGSFNENIPVFAGNIADNLLRRVLLTREVARLTASEGKFIRAVDRTVVVSPVEAERLNRTYRGASVVAIPPAAAIDEPDCRPIAHSLSFMGLLSYSPNEEGLLRFIRSIFPAIAATYPDVTFHIIGARPTIEVQSAAAQHRGHVLFTGYVDDYRTAVRGTEVFVAPIYTGSGVNVKIIDALALGMPVVTTAIGADGLPLSDGENIMIANTDDEFARHVVRLMGDAGLRGMLAAAARRYAAANHDPDTIRSKFLDAIGLPGTAEKPL
ncbi:glycosyltransferase [bacterium]|nr:glycosyltransferase [bacterium]